MPCAAAWSNGRGELSVWSASFAVPVAALLAAIKAASLAAMIWLRVRAGLDRNGALS